MLFSALIMGFAGSLHCVGMCSPLAMAVTNVRKHAVLRRIVYNGGRILVYGIVGFILGSVGWVLPLHKFQNFVSLFLGILFLTAAAFGISTFRVALISPLLQKLNGFLKEKFAAQIQGSGQLSVFFLGALNGLLPCGLTFLAFAYALTLGDPVQSFAYMVLFGLGTLPVMLGLTSILQWIVVRFHLSLRKITTTMLIISGSLLIARVFMFHHVHTPEEQHVVDIVLCR